MIQINFEGFPNIIIGKKKLGGKSHFTKDRYLSMLIRAFTHHDRVILQANAGTEETALQMINTLKYLGIELEDRYLQNKVIDGEEKEIIIFVLDKIPILRGIR